MTSHLSEAQHRRIGPGRLSSPQQNWTSPFLSWTKSRAGYSSQTWVHTTDARLLGKVYPAISIIA